MTTLRIGTRGSALALAQAEETRRRLLAAHPELSKVEIVPMMTTGDREVDRKLMDIGGKGLFTKEIEEALLAGQIDLAVHSMKDMPTALPPGLTIACLFEREDPRDALITHRAEYRSIQDLPEGASVGTSSLRRAAQVLMLRPGLRILPFRGNVPTRLKKIEEGQVDATLLAVAGLKRLGLHEHTKNAVPEGVILPAVAQGAIGIECRENDEAMHELLRPLAHTPTEIAVAAERALLAALDGSCRTPIAALAELVGGQLRLRALIATPDGTRHHQLELTGAPGDAVRLGQEAGERLRAQGGKDFFTWAQ